MHRFFCLCLLCAALCLPFATCAADAAHAAPNADVKPAPPPDAKAKSAAAGEDASAEQSGTDVPEDTWALAWESQPQYAAGMENALEELRKALPEMNKNISARLPGFESNVRGLELLAEQYAENPLALQAIHKRCLLLKRDLERMLAGAARARVQLSELLPKLDKFEDGLSGFQSAQDRVRAQELAALLKRMAVLKKKLLETQSRLTVILTPTDYLEQRLAASSEKLRASMADSWLAYYSASGRFLTISAWDAIDAKMRAQWEALKLRLPIELPQTTNAWLSAAPRFLNIFIFSGLFLFLLHAQLRRRGIGEGYRHMFTNSLPWICLGISFYGTAWGSQEEMYRFLLILGNLALTWGQLSLAWDLRRVNLPDSPRISPLGGIFPLLVLGSLVILLDPPAPLQSILWLAALLSSVLIKRRRKPAENIPPLEGGILRLELPVLWLAVFVALFGWVRISILINLFFVTLVVGINLTMGCMSTLHRLSARIPEEGFAGLLGGLLFGCAFPLLLALVLAGMLQCLISCPGGFHLVLPYLRSSISLGGVSIDVVLILLIFGAFYLTRAVTSAGRAFIRRLPESGLDPTLTTPLQTAFTYGLWMIFVLLILRVMGVSTDKLAIVAGGFSVGLGFGMQAIVNNLVSGLILIFSRTLREGDVVEVGNLTGTVRKISVRATTVETFDNAVIFVPNSEFISTRLINWTRNSRTVRREIAVGVAYGTDHKLVQSLLLAVASGNPRVLKYPKPVAFFMGFGSSTLDFSLRFWVTDYNDGLAVASDLRGEIITLLARHNVEVAFPQLDVHVKTQPAQKPPRGAPGETSPRARRAVRSRRTVKRRANAALR